MDKSRAMLVGAQRVLEQENAAARTGPAMEFFRTKQAFLMANRARLDGKLALKSEDPKALQDVQNLLEETIQLMLELQGSQFRGNTERNIAELLCLLCKIAWARGDTTSALRALERELPLRRAPAQEGEVVITLANLGRTCLKLGDITAAAKHLSEAEVLLQGLLGGSDTDSVGNHAVVRREILWLLAQCAEQQGDIEGAVQQLERLQGVLPSSLDDGSVKKNMSRLQSKAQARHLETVAEEKGSPPLAAQNADAPEQEQLDDDLWKQKKKKPKSKKKR